MKVRINLAKLSTSVVYDWWSHGWLASDRSTTIFKNVVTRVLTIPCTSKYLNVITFGGHWNKQDLVLFEYTLPLILTQLMLIYVLHRILSLVCKPLRTSAIVPQILGGILIGHSLVNWWYQTIEVPARIEFHWYTIIFESTTKNALGNLTWMALMFFHFLMGVKMDPTMIFTTGKNATVIGLFILIVPILFALWLATFLRNHMGYPYTIHRLLIFVGASQAMTCFPVVAYLLNELQILNSELGRLALSSSMISDIGFRIILIVTSNLWMNISDTTHSKYAFFGCAALFLVVLIVFRPIFSWIIRRTPKGKPVADTYVVLVILLVVVCGFFSAEIGQHVLFGPFLLGLVVPAGPPLGLTLVKKLETFFTGLLLPVFVITTGMKMDLMKIQSKHLVVLSTVLFFTFLVKLTSVFVPAICCKIPYKDAFVLCLILGYKGIVELAMLITWSDLQILDDESFTTAVLAIGLVAAVINPLVRVLYDPTRKYAGYIKRTVCDTKRNTELRIIVCIHEEENVPSIIKFLQASNPTSENPICVYLIHLVELLGRSAPLFISHQLWKQSKSATKDNLSQHIINAFRYYEKKYAGTLTVQPFTAISPIETMHDDICMLALSMRAPLIVIPFHGRWTIDGAMHTNSFGTVNNHVLNRAPCSVGLLVDRGHLGRSAISSLDALKYRVGMLFLGGNDDREALAIVGRMAANPGVEVTVLHLVSPNNIGVNEWQIKQDIEAIMKFKRLLSNATEYTLNNHVETRKRHPPYNEILIKDGKELVKLILTMEYDYDLVVVGRRFGVYSPLTVGLTNLSECPELGVLGDILALSEMKSSYSVLIVQQQIMGCALIT